MITERKPPLGVFPEHIWAEGNGSITDRIEDLKRAISEYMEAGLIVKPEWIDEYNRHAETLNKQQMPFIL